MPSLKKKTKALRNPYELGQPNGAPTLPSIIPDETLDDRKGAISPNGHQQISHEVTSIYSDGTSQSYDSSSHQEKLNDRHRVQPYPHHMQPYGQNVHTPMPITQQPSIHSYHTPRNEEVELLKRQSEWRAQLEVIMLESAERVWAAFKRAKKDKHAETGMDSPLYEATQCFFRDVKIPDKHRGCVRRDSNGIVRILPPLSAKKQHKADEEHKDRVKSHGEEHLDKLAKLYNIKASNKYDKFTEAFTKHYATTRLLKPDPLRELSLFQWLTLKMPKDHPGPPTLADIEWDQQDNMRPTYNETPFEWTSNGTTVPRKDITTQLSHPSTPSPGFPDGYNIDRRMSYTPSVSSGGSYHTAPMPSPRMSYTSMINNTPGQRSSLGNGMQQQWGASDPRLGRPSAENGYFPPPQMGGPYGGQQPYPDNSQVHFPNPYDGGQAHADNLATVQYPRHQGGYNYHPEPV